MAMDDSLSSPSAMRELFDIIPLSGKEITLGMGHPVIPNDQSLDFYRRTGKTCRASLQHPDQPGASIFCRSYNSSFEQLDGY
jgi:hypothetical protein